MATARKSIEQFDIIRPDQPGDVTAMPSPRKIGHVHIVTDVNYDKMVEFYCALLNCEVVNEMPGRKIAFLTFDNEHHRLAIMRKPGAKPRPEGEVLGYSHSAFSYASLAELLFVYKKMRDLGYRPDYTINHGNITSFDFRDPDGNRAEIFVDNFDTADECLRWKKEVQFKEDFGEMDEGCLDPDKLLALFESGVPQSVLRDRKEVVKLVREGKL